MNNTTKALIVLAGVIGGFVMAEKTFAGDKYDPKGGHHQPGVKIDFDPSIRANAKAISDAEANANAKGTAVISAPIQGATIQSGALKTDMKGGDTKITDVGNTNNSFPRQTPIAYAPGLSTSFSQQNCTSSASIGISAPFGAIGGGVPISDDNCDRRADSIRWQELQAIAVSCNRMVIDSDKNMEALKASGLTCNDIKALFIAAPAPANVVNAVGTPALDEYVTRKELNEKLDNKFKKEMGK
jgi:hypothetical protein